MRGPDETRTPSDDAAKEVKPRSNPQPANRSGGGAHRLHQRVAEVAEATLAQQQFVSAVDVLIGLGWLLPARLRDWRLGRVDCLERVTRANMHKLSDAMAIFRRWARDRGLLPRETVYVSHTRDRHRLRFSVSGKPSIERSYSTHWISPDLSQRKRMAHDQDAPPQPALSPQHQ